MLLGDECVPVSFIAFDFFAALILWPTHVPFQNDAPTIEWEHLDVYSPEGSIILVPCAPTLNTYHLFRILFRPTHG